MIKAVLIDDEPEICALNRKLLHDNFPEICVVGECGSVEEGIKLIKKHNPDIVLLDIDIKGGSGFNILQKVKPYTFKLIFITGFNEYAIKAIKFSALDYILKPVNEYEFRNAIENALQLLENQQVEKQVDNFFEHYNQSPKAKKIVLRTAEAMHIVDLHEIIYCNSDNSYTTFFLGDKRQILVSKSIKEYSEMLKDYGFIRPHQSFLVNIDHVKKVDKADGGFIVMSNGKEVPVSSRRKQVIFSYLDNI